MIGRERFAGRKPNVPPPAPKPPATPAAPEPTPKPPPKRGTPPVVRTEIVIAKCGHEVQFGHFADKQDRFRDQRRLKVINQDCPNCRKAAHEARTRAEQKAAKEKRDGQRGRVGRLPDGSRYITEYSAEQVMWKGSLIVPNGEETKVFEMEGPVLFTLLEKLDRAYRKWLNEQKPPENLT